MSVDQPVSHIEHAKMCIRAAMGNSEGADDNLEQRQINLYLANAIYNLTQAIEAQPQSTQPKAQPRKQVAPKQPKQNTWQRLPMPAYVFCKTAVLAMLQEIANYVRRA
jgi:hypothetical protein